MRNFISRRHFWAIGISGYALVISFFLSCNKLDKTDIGNELIPGSDKLITDTVSLSITTQLRTLAGINSDTTVIQKNEAHCIGHINDPVFGSTTAAIYLQPLPLSYPFKFPVSKDSLFLDSLVLCLAYAGTFGDTNMISKVNVFRVNDPDFNAGKKYRLYEAPKISNELVGSASYSRKQLTTLTRLSSNKDSSINQLRIRLNNDLGAALLSQNNVSGALQNDSTFRNFLRGFALIPDSSSSQQGALHYFALGVPTTRLQLYYRAKRADGKMDTSFALFPFSSELTRSANANKIIRKVSAAITDDPKYAYVMTAPGISTNLEIKGLDSLIGKPYIIHRAEIIASQADDNSVSDIFSPPITHLYYLNDAGAQTPIPYDSLFYFSRVSFDNQRNAVLNSIQLNYCGGNPVLKSSGSQKLAEYRFNVSRYIQNVLNKNIKPGKFRISAPYFAEFSGGNISLSPLNAIAAGRVKLNGGGHPTKPMRLLIYYSKP
jgi:hypothetical protein